MPVPIIVLLAVLAALVVLIVLYRRARRSVLFADSLSFPLILVVRPLVMLQKSLEKVAAFCSGIVEKSLRYPPNVDSDVTHIVHVLSRIILLAVSSIILCGDLYNLLLSIPILFGGVGGVSLPGGFAIPSALLYACMSALYGEVAFLECSNILPTGSHLLPKMSDTARKWFGIACAIGFVLSLVFAVLFGVFRGQYLTDPDTAGVLAIPLLGLAALIITGASVLSLWGMVVGFLGLISLVFSLVNWLFNFLAGVVSIALSPIDVFVRYITDGRWSIYIDLLGHDPHKPLTSPFTTITQLQPGQKTTDLAALPERASAVDAEIVTDEIPPIETTVLEETKIMNTDKNAFVNFVGEWGSRIYPHAAQAIDRLHATDSIFCSYYLDRSRPHVKTSMPGIRDLSHSAHEKNQSMLHGETEDEGNHTLLCDLSHTLAEPYQHLLAVRSPFVHYIDCHDLVTAVDLLESNKKRNPLISQVVFTSVSEHDSQDKGVQVGLADLVALWREGFIDGIVPVAPDAHYAVQYGVETLRRALAQLFVSLIIAPKHHPLNPSFSSVFRQFSHLSPFIGVSIASQRVAVGSMPKRFAWIPGVKGQAGTGIYADILTQTREAINRVLTEEDTCAFSSQVRTDASSKLIVNIPVALNDVKFSPIVRDTALYVGTQYPFASSLTVRANGIPLPYQLHGRYMVSVFCLYPLQQANFPTLQGVRNTKVTPLYHDSMGIEPIKGNGHIPANEQTGETKKTKAVSTTRQKKTSSTRRVARKNTKQAK